MSRLTHGRLFDSDQFTQIHNDPAHNDPGKSLKKFQSALNHGKNVLIEYHLEGGNAATLGRYQSWLIDQILSHCWALFFADSNHTDVALIAAGGYGRSELNLESDIDLLLLLADNPSKSQNQNCESFIRFCWDIGLKVGHSIRTLKQCVKIASKEISVMTNMMETRLILGNQALFSKMQQQLRKDSVWPAKKYFKAKLDEQLSRHLHFSDTAYNLEPNIKESPGGLRDLHMISWVANRYFGTSEFSELVDHRFLTEQEYKALIKGRDFLWKLRNGLHYLAGRCEDRLLFDYQKELASQLGFKARDNHLAVEQMMKRYYRTAKEIQLLNEIALQHFNEAIVQSKKPKPRKINQRFHAIGNYLETVDAKVFDRTPNAMLELFLLMQKHPELEGVRAGTIRSLRSNLNKIDADYRNSPENLATFLEIFKYQHGLTHALRRMNAYGVLGKFFPQFGKIVGQMQHDLFHIFTVDAHSLFVLGNLRRLMVDRNKDEFPVLRTILSKLNRRERLYLAALCHDIGKGSGRDHSEVGEEIALSFCGKLGMSEYDTNFVAWLVKNHLIMSWTAQREDTSDPRVVDRFAQFVGDQEHLDNLYLLTVADIRGTSHKVWSEWKGKLLSNLHSATSRRLRTGISTPDALNTRIEERKLAIRKLLGKSVSQHNLNQLWAQLDQEYFLRNGPETCAWHAQQICKSGLVDLPVVSMRYRPEIKARQILVVSPESDYLLSRSTAVIDTLGLSILDARIHSTQSGLGILVFITSTEQEHAPLERDLQQQAQQARDFLLDPPERYVPVAKNISRALKQFSVKTHISFTDNLELGHTTMEIVSQDRPGLLYHVSIALLECKVHLVSAKVSTVGEKAEDTFFITDRDGNPVSSKDQRLCLENRIKQYLGTK